MIKFVKLVTATKMLAARIGLRAPAVIQQPSEYQMFVAGKAADLLQMLQQSDLKNRFAEMQDFLKQVQLCGVVLPNQDLTGWTWYFIYENPERLDVKYPEICLIKAELGNAMGFDSFEKLHAWERKVSEMQQ